MHKWAALLKLTIQCKCMCACVKLCRDGTHILNASLNPIEAYICLRKCMCMYIDRG